MDFYIEPEIMWLKMGIGIKSILLFSSLIFKAKLYVKIPFVNFVLKSPLTPKFIANLNSAKVNQEIANFKLLKKVPEIKN